jgi:hypothetical protein
LLELENKNRLKLAGNKMVLADRNQIGINDITLFWIILILGYSKDTNVRGSVINLMYIILD